MDKEIVISESIEKEHQVIVFELAGDEYALFIEQIKEVVITPKLARVPLTPDYIKGVANVRGNILAIIDLEERFKLKENQEQEQGNSSYTLVVESKKYSMGILVSKVPMTLNITESDIDFAPDLVYDSTSQRDYIKGNIKLEDRLIILIDIFKVIE